MNDKDGRDEDEQKSDTVIGRRCWSETNWEREREREREQPWLQNTCMLAHNTCMDTLATCPQWGFQLFWLPHSWTTPLNYRQAAMPSKEEADTQIQWKSDRGILLMKCVVVFLYLFWPLCVDTHLHSPHTHWHLKQNCSAFILLEIVPIVPSSPWCVAICSNQ